MYRIRVFSDIREIGRECKNGYELYLHLHLNPDYGPDKKYYMTTDDDYTHAIIINTYMPELREGIPKERVIGFAWEPLPFLNITDEFIEYAKTHISKYFIGTTKGLPHPPFKRGNTFMFYTPPPKTIAPKVKLMSIMISGKTMAPGHKYRHELVMEILKERLPIDIYGRGCEYYDNDEPLIKGPFQLNEPYEGYLFHIAIENFQTTEYFSEKIVNPLFHETIPIYLGAKNIDKYFKNMYIPLSGNIENDIYIIKEILRFPEEVRRRHFPNREHVENTMNLFKNKNIERIYGDL